ncbi:hypothetical protein ED312_06950 [Sinomicrobium pectinilyticum]|uniref:Uncharacterized protein n=2 Tax=Sinomicrobium pectinilyticum TaxID=1084421 RepID=A0A3N0EPX8_SINP1|nr:hypothetical protein ED312_06950 [Sinomicrobium pectinilyticum]
MKVKKSKKRRLRSSLLIGSIVAALIALSPYIFYLYDSFPTEQSWEFFVFSFNSPTYQNLNTFTWIFLGKFVPLYLLFLWFFTCKHWWYHVILIPIAMYVFQLFSVINDDIRYYDEFEIYYLIPIMLIIIPLVYLIRLKLFDKVVHGIDMRKLDEELKKYEVEDDDFSK